MTLPTSGLITVNDRGARAATTFGSVAAVGGNMVFIKKLTASSSGTLSFVDGTSSVVLDSTYKEYLFTFNNMHPATNSVEFQVNFRDGGTDYDATKTTTFFNAEHAEADSTTGLSYITADDLAQGTGFQPLTIDTGNRGDESCSGTLQLFNPSSTTFVKHFIARTNNYVSNNFSEDSYIAGYCNVTAAIDGVQFKFASGNIDSGDICLYGIL
tara:strand:+ start:479 stop:1114 length:636 start_codon:yes stop_codon:yes gene_type:complete